MNQEDVLKIKQIAEAAGEILLSFWPGSDNSDKNLGIQHKADQSIVTNADLASNDFILKSIAELFPNDGIMSEECEIPTDLNQKEHVWMVDPLDGTSAFSKGTDQFAVLIARITNNLPDYGIMYFPVRKLCVEAYAGKCIINDQPVRVSDFEQPRSEKVYVRLFEPNDPQKLAHPVALDSSVGFLNVITGEFDGFVMKSGRLNEYDLAAPFLAIKNAGGKVTDELDQEIKFHFAETKFKYMICSNGKTHQELKKLIP